MPMTSEPKSDAAIPKSETPPDKPLSIGLKDKIENVLPFVFFPISLAHVSLFETAIDAAQATK